MIHYFAYGSNLYPMPLSERVFSANLIGGVELENYLLAFLACRLIQNKSNF